MISEGVRVVPSMFTCYTVAGKGSHIFKAHIMNGMREYFFGPFSSGTPFWIYATQYYFPFGMLGITSRGALGICRKSYFLSAWLMCRKINPKWPEYA